MDDMQGPFGAECGACPYLPDRSWRIMFFEGTNLGAGLFGRFLALGFRRSGGSVYSPDCETCLACVPLRVRVDMFRPTADQRRSLRKNRDVVLEIGPPSFSEEKMDLYRSFLRARYPDKEAEVDREGYEHFFVRNLGQAHEFRYTVGRRLVGVGIVDVVPTAASSVYFYFDPAEARRSLGTYSALQEIAFCRATGRTWLYLGYWVDGCRAMTYKARFAPHEVMRPDGTWVLRGAGGEAEPGAAGVHVTAGSGAEEPGAAGVHVTAGSGAEEPGAAGVHATAGSGAEEPSAASVDATAGPLLPP